MNLEIQYPIGCWLLVNIFYLCKVEQSALHIDESVLAFILVPKSGKFQVHQGNKRNLHHLFDKMCTICVLYHTSVGYCLFDAWALPEPRNR